MRPWFVATAVLGVALTALFSSVVLFTATKEMAWPVWLGIGAFMGFTSSALGLLGAMVLRGFATDAPKIVLGDGEQLWASLSANHFRGLEARGGRVFWTSTGLRFVPHGINFQRQAALVPWGDIVAVDGLGMFAAIEHSGGIERFVVPDPAGFVAATVRVLEGEEGPAGIASSVAGGRSEPADRQTLTARP